MTKSERAFIENVGESWKGATPGLVVQAFEKGRKKIDVCIGETAEYYDWASLTKIVFSVTACMHAVDEKKISLSSVISKNIPWFRTPELQKISVKNVLSHSAGFAWWYPFYEDIDRMRSRLQRWYQLQEILETKIVSEAREKAAKRAASKKKAVEKAVYSDLDFFVIGVLLERLHETGLLEIWQKQNERFCLEQTGFNVDNEPRFKKKLYAPTEDSPWRGRIMQGEVHDDNTWALGGVAPHAGLFGPLNDLSKWGLALRKTMLGDKVKGFPKPETVQKFTKRAIPKEVGDWAVGFMLPTYGTASAGRYFSLKSVGHTGFTGTSLWFDPKRDLLVTILSNRVYPTRENQRFLQLRPQLHNWVVESLSI